MDLLLVLDLRLVLKVTKLHLTNMVLLNPSDLLNLLVLKGSHLREANLQLTNMVLLHPSDHPTLPVLKVSPLRVVNLRPPNTVLLVLHLLVQLDLPDLKVSHLCLLE